MSRCSIPPPRKRRKLASIWRQLPPMAHLPTLLPQRPQMAPNRQPLRRPPPWQALRGAVTESKFGAADQLPSKFDCQHRSIGPSDSECRPSGCGIRTWDGGTFRYAELVKWSSLFKFSIAYIKYIFLIYLMN